MQSNSSSSSSADCGHGSNDQSMKYKAIVCDVDDTLVQSLPHALPSQQVITAIKNARKRGVVFSIATGRSIHYLKDIISALDLSGLIIIDGGATLYDIAKHTAAWQSLIPGAVVQRLLKILQTQPHDYSLIDDGHEHRKPATQGLRRVTKIGVYGIPLKKEKELAEELSIAGNVHITAGSGWDGKHLVDLSITNPDATKHHGILKFAEALGISTKEIIGIGDHANDFPLLMACGLKVAMGNAVPDIKAIADYIAPTVDEDGVADVIEKFVLK